MSDQHTGGEPPALADIQQPIAQDSGATAAPADSGGASGELTQAMPGLLRFAALMWIRGAIWGVETSARLVRLALSPEDALRRLQEVRSGLRTYAWELLGIQDLDERLSQIQPGPGSQLRASARGGELSLREQGAELLRQSADVNADDGAHPAYARILSELAPDEGRILRLLATEGAQPTIDVRSANLIGVGSQLVAQGLNLIGTEAGCRHPDRVPLYLNNLDRLGLVWFPRDPIEDPMRYQVLEAQPDAMDAMKHAGRAKTVHRSVKLTNFGEDFCHTVLPLDD